jgi:hypothetical protein
LRRQYRTAKPDFLATVIFVAPGVRDGCVTAAPAEKAGGSISGGGQQS